MADCHDINADLARQLLIYDPSTGFLTWKPRTPDMFMTKAAEDSLRVCSCWNSKYAGKQAGSIDARGYVITSIKFCREGHRYSSICKAHRLAWLIMTGSWPALDIDHIDGNRLNNKWDNIRQANQSENSQNRIKRKDNTSGFVGVHRNHKNHKWVSRIFSRGKYTYLGEYDTPEEASKAYCEAKMTIHTFQPTLREQT